MNQPAEKRLEWKDYQDIFLTPKRIASGQRFKRSWKQELDAIDRKSLSCFGICYCIDTRR
ncbi:hypothetical protein CI610_00533 [invertebrate metagenome]|uniref:Transglycosylase SLT domain-containing protein n=1 Tax=invertebrate metagenome TaxID=1711999 RepID=A0A2H9TB30_9ZZZZ